MANARKLELRAAVVLVAGLLALGTVWAGSALGGGSGGSGPAQTGKKAPAQKSSPGLVQDKQRHSGRDCPYKGRGGDRAATLLSAGRGPAAPTVPASAWTVS